ncbi:MAG: PQQ-like beta-propeller repeat protein [Oscillospiraceae bacterium]|nr:PQQ-like beta-propeller repeat protein [Oscillospiraceae bacterium]
MKTCKRLSALFLMLCLLFSMIVPAVYADGESSAASSSNGTLTYRFGYQAKSVRAAAACWPGEEVSFYYEGTDYSGSDATLGYSKSSFLNMNTGRGYDAYYNGTGHDSRYINFRINGSSGWFALKIYGVKAGTYTLNFDATFTEDTFLYVMTGNAYQSAIAGYQNELKAVEEDSKRYATAITESLTGVATLRDGSTSAQATFAVDGAGVGEYVLLFKTSKAVKMFGLTMTPGAAGGTTQTPSGSDKPAEEEAKLPVNFETAYKDIVATVECERAAVDEVDGQDYLYLLFKGQNMLVYNLDTGELVDKKSDVFTTPRDVYIDENDIVWVCGATKKLYRYDPRTKEGTSIPMGSGLFPITTSFNVFGLSGDGQGNLYFGTYDTGYLGKYDTKTGEFFQLSSHLNSGSSEEADATYAGGGGIIVKDGYAYFAIDGNKNMDDHYTHEMVKFDLTTNQIVDYLDFSHLMASTTKLPVHVNLIGDKYLIASTGDSSRGTVIVDITGEKMELVTIEGVPGVKGGISDVLDGKVYFMGQGNTGLLAMDVATGAISSTKIGNDQGLSLEHGSFVTIDGLPGPSLLTYTSPRGLDTVDLRIYNLATGETKILTDYTKGEGSGNQLRSIALSEDGKIVYVGAYGASLVVGYDVATGKKVQEFYTGGSQNDSLLCHNGYLYAGIYSQCSIGQYNPSTGEGTVLSQINNGAFYQNRVHAIAAGDGKVFVGTVPAIGHLGGALMWYDMEQNRIYVTVGPDPTDVYYTNAGNTTTKNWYSAYTDTPADGMLDVNVDGRINTTDYFITIDGVDVPVYTGVIENQCINNLIYKDGYLIGSTTRYGGSSSIPENINACIFIYDVDAMKVVTTCDVTEFISGLTTPVDFIDAMAEDPDIKGKFWGVVSDTLFSFNIDLTTQTISNVTEELSLGKIKYTAGGCNWDSRDILFDGDYMYVVFGQKGTYMIERDNVKNYVQLSTAVPKQMVQAADGNIYFINNQTNLQVLKIADLVQDVMDEQGVPKVAGLINALPDASKITLDDEAAVLKARASYDALSSVAKKLVDITRLKAAEVVVKPLRQAADQAAVNAVQAKINAIGTVTLDSEAAINDARDAYNALSEGQKAKVNNYKKLTKAESDLAYEKIPAEEKAVAAEVVAMINSIGKITLDSKAKIVEVRKAYDALSPAQMNLVTNLEVLTAAEDLYYAMEEKVLKTYNFSYQTACTELGLKLNGNNLMNTPTSDSIKNYYDQGIFNWHLHSYNSSLRGAQFDPEGFLMARSIPGDWMAFVINNPGQGTYRLTMNHFATFCGAEEMNVYIIPYSTKDVEAALTEENLVGVVNCYDADNVTSNMDKPDNSTMTSSVMGTWTPGDDAFYIVVYKCQKANPDALANYELRKANASDRGSNMYVSQLMMMQIDSEIKSVQTAIDNMVSADKVTMRSKADIQAVRAKYDALGTFKKPYVDITKLVEAEKAYLKAAGIFNFSYVTECKALGLTSGSNNLLSSAFTSKLKDYRSKSYFNWGVESVKSTLTEAVFSENGYLKLRSKEGDWVAFTIDNPGAGPWKLSLEYVACATAAEEMKVYILPAGTKDIEAALTEDRLISTINSYDANNVPAAGDDPAAGAYSTKNMGYIVTGSEKGCIVVVQCAKANSSSNAYNSNMYISKLVMELDEKVKTTLDAIDAIDRVTLESEAAIRSARAAYKLLDKEQRTLITNLDVLVAAEKTLEELLTQEDRDAARAVETLINAIGTVTMDSRIPIAVASKAFSALTDVQERYVSNLATLLQAEIKLNDVRIEIEGAASREVDALIDAIGKVTLESGAAIKDASFAYDMLTDDQKRMVEKHDVLLAAKAEYASLKSAADKKTPAATKPVTFDFDVIAKNTQAKADGLGSMLPTNTITHSGAQEGVKKLKENGYINWYYHSSLTSTSSTSPGFYDKRGYVYTKSTAIGEDYIAFFIDNPGRAVWDVTVYRPMGIYGASEIGVYILPQDTGDISAALSEENRIGTYSSYKKGGLATPEQTDITGENATFRWTNESGMDESLILVVRVDGAESSGSARLYLSRIELNPTVDTVIWLIDSIGTVTADSKAEIENVRAAYDALTEDQKEQVTNYKVLTKAEKALDKALNGASAGGTVITVVAIVAIIAVAAGAIVVILKKKKK